ncbi:TonB-dependent receptor [Sphingobium yanoikuyae]|nr:TonB-dependent receptor [Sphingobium yanoikuyae]
MRIPQTLCCASITALCLAASVPAAAQTAAPADGQIASPTPPQADAPLQQGDITGDIVVTAQRKSERLQDVGIAVAAFSGEALRTQGVTQSLDIAKFTPGVSASGTLGGQGMQFSIRGVTQSDYNDAIEAPVAVYIDDVYISSQQGQGMALYDMARVEVLKGPQGTLFGRNATGGLAHFIVNKPELGTTSGYIDATYGRFNQTKLEGAINLPLGEQFALRASGIWNRHDSVWKNVYPAGVVAGAPLNFGPAGVSPAGQDLGDEDALAGRLQLLWEPSAAVQIRLTGSAFRQNLSESPWTSSAVVPQVDSAGRVVGGIFASPTETRSAIGPDGQNYFNPSVLPFQGFQFSPTGDGRRAPGANWFGYVPVDIGKRQLSKDFALSDLNRFRAYNGTLHVDADLGGAQLASVTAWSQYRKNFLLDADGSPVNGLAFGTKSNIRTFSQELRLNGESGALSWTGGAYYLHITADNAQGLLAPKGSALSAVFGMTTTGVDPISVFTLKTDSASIFGQTSWEFAPKFNFILGGRLIREHQSYDFSSGAYANVSDYSVDTGTLLFPLQPSFSDKRTEWLWAGKAQIEYRPTSGLLLYAGINRGVKAGSYNGKLFDGTAALTPAQIPYRPEILTSFEGGFKLTGPGSRYTLNGTFFHYRYNDYQSFVFSDISGFVQNRDARTNGVEMEATARIGNDLRVGVTGSYIDAKVKDLQIAPGVFRDTRPTYTPKYSAGANIRYTVPVAIAGGDLSVGGVLSYQSSFYQNARNFASEKFAGRTLIDLSTDWSAGSGITLSAFVRNLTDKRYKTVGLDLATACGCNLEAYGMPRTWGVSIGYKF